MKTSSSKNRGIALYLTVMILSLILVLSLGAATLFSSQLRTLKDIGQSVLAYYAAESGVEKALFNQWAIGTTQHEVLDNEASFDVWVLGPGVGGCAGTNYCIKSIGVYRDVRRAIRLTR